eukprot:m.366194 g.366194  ORF g.366194 m.366194 type:complete len:727 (-) comp16658_c2_seq29:170-2350(-)
MSASKRPRIRLELPDHIEPVDPEKHVTFPMEPTIEALMAKYSAEKNDVIFVRGPVGAGKSSLVLHMARTRKCCVLMPVAHGEPEVRDSFVKRSIVSCAKVDNVENLDCLRLNQIEEGTDPTVEDCSRALLSLGEKNILLIFDEAHVLFGIDPSLQYVLFKERPVSLLLVSAASETVGLRGKAALTHGEIKDKYMWIPQAPDPNDMEKQLNDAGLCLTARTVSVVLMIVGGSRSLFMYAMRWIRDQGFDEDKAILAAIRRGISNWQTGLLDALSYARAVKVNGQFSSLQSLPEAFIEVLVQGSAQVEDRDDRRDLTISGLLLPDPWEFQTDELFPYNWDAHGRAYRVSNPLQALYYRDMLIDAGHLKIKYDVPIQSCPDLLAHVLPLMSFAAVVAHPTRVEGADPVGSLAAALGAHGLAPEDCYTGAILKFLATFGYSAAHTLHSSKLGGKADVYVELGDERLVMELVHFRNLAGHLERFSDPAKKTYSSDYEHKALVCICHKDNQVDAFFDSCESKPDDVFAIALLVATHHAAYRMFVWPAHSERTKDEYVLRCDHVAKSLVDGKITPAQSVDSIRHMDYQAQMSATKPPAAAAGAGVVERVQAAIDIVGQRQEAILKKEISKEDTRALAETLDPTFSGPMAKSEFWTTFVEPFQQKFEALVQHLLRQEKDPKAPVGAAVDTFISTPTNASWNIVLTEINRDRDSPLVPPFPVTFMGARPIPDFDE